MVSHYNWPPHIMVAVRVCWPQIFRERSETSPKILVSSCRAFLMNKRAIKGDMSLQWRWQWTNERQRISKLLLSVDIWWESGWISRLATANAGNFLTYFPTLRMFENTKCLLCKTLTTFTKMRALNRCVQSKALEFIGFVCFIFHWKTCGKRIDGYSKSWVVREPYPKSATRPLSLGS